MKKSGEHIRVNFGQSPFVFDIDGMMSVRRLSTPPIRSILPNVSPDSFYSVLDVSEIPRYLVQSVAADRYLLLQTNFTDVRQREKKQIQQEISSTR